MIASLYVITLIIIASNRVESACDFDTIVKINSLWGDNAPNKVLDKLIGTITYLYVPHVLKITEPGFKCIKTVLEEDAAKIAIDYHLYEDNVTFVKYLMDENQLNITRSYVDGDESAVDYVFPVYLNNGVFGFWQCRDDYDSFINVGVLNYQTRKDEEEVQKAIKEAENELQMLGFELPPRSQDC